MSNIERIKHNFGWTLRFSTGERMYQVSITEYVHVKEEDPRRFVVCLFLLGENYPARPRASVNVWVDRSLDEEATVNKCLAGLLSGLESKIREVEHEYSCVEGLMTAVVE